MLKKGRVNQGREKKNAWKKGAGMALAITLAVSGVSVSGITSYATQSSTEAESTEEQTTEQNATTAASTEEATTQSQTIDASIAKARQDAAEAARNKREAQEILDNLKSAKSNIETYIIELDKSLNEIQIEISHLEENQKELQKSIKKSKKKLKLAKTEQKTQYEAMKNRIQMVYESGDEQYLDILLTASSMTDMLNKTEYISQVSLYDYNTLKELKTAKEQVANLKQKLDKDLETNEVLQAKVKSQKATVEILLQEKSAQMAEYEKSIEGQEQEVSKYAKAEAEAEAIIAEAERNTSMTTDSGTTYVGGVFTWPVPGSTIITSDFGMRVAPTAGATSEHNGIDIGCSMGDQIVAAASGTVIVSTYSSSAGNYICIDHGGGVVTVYMHNTQLLVNVGESVTAGQTIALAGSTGVSTGPHCHFGVRVNGQYVDPMIYLKAN